MIKRALTILLVLAMGLGIAQKADYLKRFEQAWKLVADYYYDLHYRGVDWRAVGERYREQIAESRSWPQVYRLLADMYGELGDRHSTVLNPRDALDELRGQQCFPLPFPVEHGAQLARVIAREKKEFGIDNEGAEESSEPAWGEFEASLKNNVAYLRIPVLLDHQLTSDLSDAVKNFEKKGVKGYVLDLRDNPGGMALIMAEVAGVFMRGLPWRIVTRTKGAIPQPTLPFWGKPLTSKPLVVIINGRVNSAAEGLAGALKMAHRATLVGERTAGNTEVVLPYCFPDGGVAMLASGLLAPIGATTWEGRGVTPDVKVVGEQKQLQTAIDIVLGSH